MINRIGTFFILLGLGLIGLFILSDIAEAPTCNLLILGAISLILGIVLYLRDPVKPGPPAQRFRLFRGFGKKPPAKK
jgi:predicted membrane channel-forming protein YqfA (hemolysin III family)